MKKKIFCAPILATLGVSVSVCAQAAGVNSGDILHISSPTFNTFGYVSGGSYFGMDTNSDGKIAAFEKRGLYEGTTGLMIGSTTLPGAYHTGAPNSGDTGSIDLSWNFAGNTGTDYVRVPVTGSTTAGLNLSGWTVAWNSIPAINMGGGAWQPLNCAALGCSGHIFTNGNAMFSWDGVYGHTYVLNYSAIVPAGDPSNFGGTAYYLHLEGTVQQAVVPIPAAVWLFGSGLLGLVGFVRRQKK